MFERGCLKKYVANDPFMDALEMLETQGNTLPDITIMNMPRHSGKTKLICVLARHFESLGLNVAVFCVSARDTYILEKTTLKGVKCSIQIARTSDIPTKISTDVDVVLVDNYDSTDIQFFYHVIIPWLQHKHPKGCFMIGRLSEEQEDTWRDRDVAPGVSKVFEYTF